MYFNFEKAVSELKEKYTENSINDFLYNEWTKARMQNEITWNVFVANSKYLVKREIFEPIVIHDGVPYLNFGYKTFVELERDGIYLTNDDKDEFEARMVYLIHNEKLDWKRVRIWLHKIVKSGNPFMGVIRNVKYFRENQKANEQVSWLLEKWSEDDEF